MKEKRARSRAAALAILCLALGACAEEAALGNLFGWSAEPPEYLGCKTLTATEVQFYFSTPVNVRQATFHPDAPIERTDDGAAVSIHLAGEHTGGEELTAELLVEDPHG
ncbi:MAG: hypothetical protein LBS82_02095, partial [Spirochaetaceae bacterium]|nr:hypothetical protein [Spirochaetaceae bacterium]